jgi:glutathione synthase/RimK-type ligase-like ATP-grasp enzyme
MTEFNADRTFVALLKEICAERNIAVTDFSDNWVFCLQQEGRIAYVFGYDFGLNSATAKLIAKDKSATSDLLAFHNIPHVEHRLFHSPQLADYVPLSGNWPLMIEYFEQHGRDIVCKPNEGTGGIGVSRARNLVELEKVVLNLFRQHRSICFSPFENMGAEYRVGVLRGRAEFAYRKERPALKGDGRSQVRELLAEWIGRQPELSVLARIAAEISAIPQEELDRKPGADELIELNWRHNLGQGAAPTLLDFSQGLGRKIVELALRAVTVLDVQVASVDVAEIGESLKVLEVNSGIMMESFARIGPENLAIAKQFYDKIICAVMEEAAPRLG